MAGIGHCAAQQVRVLPTHRNARGHPSNDAVIDGPLVQVQPSCCGKIELWGILISRRVRRGVVVLFGA